MSGNQREAGAAAAAAAGRGDVDDAGQPGARVECAAHSRFEVTAGDPRRPHVCRRIQFGHEEDAHEENLGNLFLESRQDAATRARARDRWNFDFDNEIPLPGAWDWQRVEEPGVAAAAAAVPGAAAAALQCAAADGGRDDAAGDGGARDGTGDAGDGGGAGQHHAPHAAGAAGVTTSRH